MTLNSGSYTAFTLHNYSTARHGTARVRHGLFGPHLHCDNQRRAHWAGVMNRHVSSRAYSRLFGSCYATVMALYSCSSRSLSLSSSSQSSLKKRRQRMRLRSLRFKQRQSRKKALELFHRIHACCVYIQPSRRTSISSLPHNSTSLRVSSSLHVASIALLWEAFTKFSDTIRINPFTARFLCLHLFIKPCRAVPYWASTPVLCKACQAGTARHGTARHGTFQFVFTLTLQTVPCRAVLARFFEPV